MLLDDLVGEWLELGQQDLNSAVKTRYPYPRKLDETTIKKSIVVAADSITFIRQKLPPVQQK